MLFDLVFEGGGVRGIAFIGALEALAAQGHQIDRVMGASVGGLTAAFLATGHDAASMRANIFDAETGRMTLAEVIRPYAPFSREAIEASATRHLLHQIDFASVPNAIEPMTDSLLARRLMNQEALFPLFTMLEHTSLRAEAPFMTWVTERLNAHAGSADWASMGLAELYRRNGRSLTVIASNLSNQSMMVLNHSTAPNLPLKWAVRMTTSVPYLFPPVIWQPEWGLYRQRRVDGHVMADGALLSQFPMELFLSASPEIEAIMGQRQAGNNVLGLLLDETAAVPGLRPSTSVWEERISSIPGIEYGLLLLKTLMANSQTAVGTPVESHVLRLPTMGVHTYGFDTAQAQLITVINHAYNVTQDFLNGWQKEPRELLTPFEKQYVQVIAEKFVVSGDYYNVGDIVNSNSIAIGPESTATTSHTP